MTLLGRVLHHKYLTLYEDKKVKKKNSTLQVVLEATQVTETTQEVYLTCVEQGLCRQPTHSQPGLAPQRRSTAPSDVVSPETQILSLGGARCVLDRLSI